MANLDIAERRLPQDGRIELTVGGHPVDLRVSVLPTMFGESVVMRVLDRTVVSLDLNKVGMNEQTMREFRKVMKKPNGIILVTGPTGSGKTTTLYSALSELNEITEKIITTEDPVEYDIDGIIQIPIDSEIGNTFAQCLRAILRQDPDKILVGEIRDTETAEIAVQASLTGHTVFSTLHTNNAREPSRDCETWAFRRSSSPRRSKPFLRNAWFVECAITAASRSRFRTRSCHSWILPAKKWANALYRGKGCDKCNNTGYKGRVGLFELLIMNDDLREMILKGSSTDELRVAARNFGMVTLRDIGMDFAYQGVTTADEVIRETIMDG